MNRAEFRCAFREARKVIAFQHAVRTIVDIDVVALTHGMDIRAVSAACRLGDPLQWSYFRLGAGWYPKLNKVLHCAPSPLPGRVTS